MAQNQNTIPGICGTNAPDLQWEQYLQALINQGNLQPQAAKGQAPLYTIPVIVHVIHGGEALGVFPNIDQGQINSQIRVLNHDFGGIGFNAGNYPATAFTSWAADEGLPAANLDGLGRVKIANCNIQFCLATKDTAGNLLAEPGIERIDYNSRSGWVNPASFSSTSQLKTFIDGTVKPQTIWNVSKYFNIWITDNNVASTNLLGYATFPVLSGLPGIPVGAGTPVTDGIWVYSATFGSKDLYPTGTYHGSYTRGRTTTHEVGHWLGIRHIGGDGNSNSQGDCDATDFCSDTPPQKGGFNSGAFGQNFGSPIYPLFATGNNACALAPNGSMFMNFMDYTDDHAKYMFSPDQAARMLTAMTNGPYRKFLGTHNLCSVEEIASVAGFKTANAVCQGAAVTLSNTSYGTPVPSYTWSVNGSANFLPDASSASAIVFADPGTYVVTLATNNGTASVFSKTIVVSGSPTLALSVQSGPACLGVPLAITASGGNTYTWQPEGITGPVLNYDGFSDINYTCTAKGTNGCTSSVTIVLTTMDCTGIKDHFSNENSFIIYPNPSKGVFNLRSKLDSDTKATIEISDISGKVIDIREVTFTKDSNGAVLNLETLTEGMYLMKISTDQGASYFTKILKD